MEFVEL